MRTTLTLATFLANLASLTALVAALSSYSTCPAILTPTSHSCPPVATATPMPYSAGYIPIINDLNINNVVCAIPPGLVATDGCDDVCVLAGCCNGWQIRRPIRLVKLPNGKSVDCASVNCGNVCRMACDREGTPEACVNPCNSLTSRGTAYV